MPQNRPPPISSHWVWQGPDILEPKIGQGINLEETNEGIPCQLLKWPVLGLYVVQFIVLSVSTNTAPIYHSWGKTYFSL
jgi:hypothetical protein